MDRVNGRKRNIQSMRKSSFMTTYTMNRDFDDTYVIGGQTRDKWIFTERSKIQAPDYGISEYSNNRIDIVIHNIVWGELIGILSSSVRTSITIGRKGDHKGDTGADGWNGVGGGDSGIDSGGDGAKVVNHALIFGSDTGLVSSGNGLVFHNYGAVGGGNEGIRAYRDNSLIVNEKSGEILGGHYGVYLSQDFGETSRTVNHGTIEALSDEAPLDAFRGGRGDDTLIKGGKIKGDVEFGGRDNLLDNRGARITGNIIGGSGDDVYIFDKPRLISETATGGEDVIKATVTFSLSLGVERLYLIGKADIDAKGTEEGNRLQVNSGDNKLFGWGGYDYLDGRKGKDLLNGGADPDHFIFATGYGKDTIVDFEPGIDRIDLPGWKAISNFNDLKNNHAENHGQDVWIIAGRDTLVIKGLHKAGLEPDFFGI